MFSSLDSSSLYTSTVQLGPSSPPSSNAALLLHPCLQTSYPPFRPLGIFFLCTLPTSSCSWLFSYISYFLFSLTRSEFFNAMLEVFEPGTLNYHILPRLILKILYVFRNPALTHLLLSGFSALRSDRTHSRSGILSPDITHTSGGVIIFVGQGLSF